MSQCTHSRTIKKKQWNKRNKKQNKQKTGEEEGKTSPVWGLVTVEGRRI
jgi:hypothetical protein